MALTTVPLPFGLRDLKVKQYNPTTNVLDVTYTDLPYARTLSFTDSEDFEELRGDDSVVASRGAGPGVEWDLEAGGISLDAYAKMFGGIVTESGTTPAQVKTFAKVATTARPYFKLEGQIISDSGGDLHAVLYRCKATGNVEGEFADGQFFVTSASGIAVPDSTGKLYDFVQNETAAAIA